MRSSVEAREQIRLFRQPDWDGESLSLGEREQILPATPYVPVW